MKTRILPILTVLISALSIFSGCTKDNLPAGLDWTVVNNPSRFPLANDKIALVYEVRVKNSTIDSYSFQSVNVKDAEVNYLDLAGADLDTIISVYHSNLKTVRAGETAFMYMWVEVSPDLPFPGTLTQTIRFSRTADGVQYGKELKVTVNQAAPVVLSAPLKARRYAAAGAPANNSYHRRTINFIDEKFWTSQRYAVDLIGLDAGNRYRQGRQNTNEDYYGYMDVVYSMTGGQIVSLIDTLPNNIPPNVPAVDPTALYRSGGNQIVVKVSEGVYVFYGHLVLAGTNLRVGDQVEAGQSLARLGNSGNSDAPQLHVQVMDGPDPLRSNGLPWVFDHFILEGSITGYDHTDGVIFVNYLTIQRSIALKNLKGDAVIGF